MLVFVISCILILLTSRISLYSETNQFVPAFGIEEIAEEPDHGFNLAPSRHIASIVEDDGRRVLQSHYWGIDRHLEGRDPETHINARSDNLFGPAWRKMFLNGRSIVVVDNFFLFADVDGVTTPFLFRRKDGEMMGLAGLWEAYRQSDATTGRRCIILTTAPNSLVGRIHGRSPAILQEKDFDLWLDSEASDTELMALLKPYAGELLCYPVTKKMNNSTFESPVIVKPDWDFDKKPPEPAKQENPDQGSLF